MTDDTPPSGRTRLCAYNGGVLMRRDLRRILSLAGWDVSTGIPNDGDWIGIWGRSPTAWRGEAVAGWTDAPILTIEDAFLRSTHPGRTRHSTPAGLCIDKTGVHFDASAPSDLETLLLNESLDDTALLDRARSAIDRIKYWKIGKYSATDPEIVAPQPGYVLVVDQTEGDAALMGAGRDIFQEMLVTAAEENPGARILIKGHPETVGGARKGIFKDNGGIERAEIFNSPIDNWSLLEGAIAVYTHSSTFGFEAIFAGHKPHVFGTPFYAGWGRTIDHADLPRRGRSLTRAQLFAASMILYPTWYDPISDDLCEIEDAIGALAAQARAFREDKAGYVGLGARRWKRSFLKRAFGRDGKIIFARSASSAASKSNKTGAPVLAWGQSEAPENSIRIEDGFLRSRGLGAVLAPPISLARDPLGIYFDPQKPSLLDQLIRQSSELPLAELERSERIIGQLNRVGLTKYNISKEIDLSLPDRPKILAVGQVEDDASVLFGSPMCRSNLELLQITRRENPDAFLIWKPHPDVEAGLRKGKVATTDLEGLIDLELPNVGANDAIRLADEIWTMSSTLGFEALIRGKPVTCVGLPFYSGWGLTNDLCPLPDQRGTHVSLARLAHACLIGYPRYFHPQTGMPISAEQAIWQLQHGDDQLFEPYLGSYYQRIRRFFPL